MSDTRRAWLLAASVLVWAASSAAEPPADTAAAVELPAKLQLAPGQIRTLAVDRVTRVAVGDPAVADVTVISPNQLLVKAKQNGETNFIVWDAGGQHELQIAVSTMQSAEGLAKDVQDLLQQLNVPGVRVHEQFGKIFLLGTVPTDAVAAALEQAVSTFGGQVLNLTSVVPEVAAPGPLVSLSVQVLEISREELNRLGVNWSDSVSLSEASMSASSPADQLLRIGQTTQRSTLSATLHALVTRNKARILSEPKLVTASGKPASSFIGLEVPIINASSFGSGTGTTNVSIDFRKTGVLLEMTPEVAGPENPIAIKMKAEVSSIDTASGLNVPVGASSVLVPGFRSRKAETEVNAQSGETVVIAGLLEASDEQDIDAVPGLEKMPVLGRLFRSPTDQTAHRELVITVTPELLADEAATAEKTMALDQALAVAEVTASVENPRLRYALQVQDRIAKALRYPQREKELNLGGTVKLRLHLFADGTLGRATVGESSGISALDEEAVKAAETQGPYPGFPSEMAERDLWLDVPVIFRP